MSSQEFPNASEPMLDRNVTTIISAGVGLGLLALVAFGFLAPGGGRPHQGDPAPDFSVALLDGSQVSLGELRGQVVVLNFWASWCVACRQEAPVLQEAWETYESTGVIFLGVAYKDAKDASQEFVREFGLTYGNGFDERGRISRAYGVVAVPETFVIDRDGSVAWVRIGEIQTGELSEQLEQMQNR